MDEWDDEGLRSHAKSCKKAWAISGKIQVNTDQTEPAKKTVSLQADFSDDPGVHTVQFQLKRPPPPAGTRFLAECEALITWLVNGNQISRRITVQNGASISGPSEAVSVIVYDTSAQVSGPPTDVEYEVTISVSKGQRAANSVPPMLHAGSYTATSLNPTGLIEIPADAGVTSLNVVVGDNSGGGAYFALGTVTVNMSQGGIPAGQVYDPREFQWVPIKPTADAFTIFKTGAGTAICMVTFGIDG